LKKNKRKQQQMNKQCFWLRTKVKNIVKDHHWKAINFYCKNYQNIIIPKMDEKSLQKAMKKQLGLKEGSKMIRRLMVLSHNKFVDRLKNKAQEYKRQVIEANESYTSKTCGQCGKLHPNLGGTEIYKCGYCGLVIDRDISGARNILIKNTQ